MYSLRGGIGNVDQGQVHRCGDGLSHLVHGVGTQHQTLRTRRLQGGGRMGQQLTSLMPLTRTLQGFDLGKIHAVKHQFGRMQASQALLDAFVDETVVRHGGLPTHATDQTECFHGHHDRRGKW